MASDIALARCRPRRMITLLNDEESEVSGDEVAMRDVRLTPTIRAAFAELGSGSAR